MNQDNWRQHLGGYGYEWRYLAFGLRNHALRKATDRMAVCGAAPGPDHGWHGVASQEEYRTSAMLPPCSRCIAGINRLHRPLRGNR